MLTLNFNSQKLGCAARLQTKIQLLFLDISFRDNSCLKDSII